ncbi:FAD-dependent oxidoreductase [Paenibacillus roseipurpureus]|uniref:FAD-dependent oxidoreductase n=1 Tax=Paenibacillus roseopurpureus TaxID=2918901 RepID=A0AA96RJ57_9BACL|nr:FAD-dependent oxidoreductase [Paenibacillus sp. MBLB1832]WNR42801.1 FAD-dependent oxidoreductase [Paenibacillus sp. MBLB1832]
MSYTQKKVDVLVLGGGAAGVCAAISAARAGKKVLLVESQGCLGGSRTATGVDTFYGFYTPKGQQRIVGGIPWEIAQLLTEANAAFERKNTYGAGTGITYDVEILKVIYEQSVLDSGAELLYHTYASRVHVSDGYITGVVLANKQGLTEVSANIYIDTTGDGDIAARSGAPFEKSDAAELQSLSTIFFMANVDISAAKSVSHDELAARMRKANQSGHYSLPREEGSWHITPHAGVIQANMVRVSGVDATDPYALTLAEVEGRRQTRQYVRFLKEYVAGFEDAFLVGTSHHIGIRETRRIQGEYMLTEEDVVIGRKFEDGIACCGAPVEDHGAGKDTRWVYVKDDGYYHIPYRCLVPKEIQNLLVAGRCLSATHSAQASARNSAQCMAMGQAAGTAAVISLEQHVPVSSIPIPLLLERLRSQDVVI